VRVAVGSSVVLVVDSCVEDVIGTFVVVVVVVVVRLGSLDAEVIGALVTSVTVTPSAVVTTLPLLSTAAASGVATGLWVTVVVSVVVPSSALRCEAQAPTRRRAANPAAATVFCLRLLNIFSSYLSSSPVTLVWPATELERNKNAYYL